MATILPVMALVKSNTDSKETAAVSTINTEISMGEIFCGLNFQEIKTFVDGCPTKF